MNKVLIVVTSYTKKGDRVFQGDEWCDSWRFSELENLRIRRKTMARSEEVKSLSELPQRTYEDAIVWIRGKELPGFSHEVADLVRKLRNTNVVYLSYHDALLGRDIATELGNWDRMMPYSLSSGIDIEKFKAIIKTDRRGEKYLNSEADFNELFRFFFLKPTDVIPVVLHKMTGALAVIDLDLQYIQDKGFAASAWKQLENSYTGGRATEKLNECRSVLYQNPISLKRLYEGETVLLPKEKSATLQSRWEQLTKLLPEEETVPTGAAVNVDRLYEKVEKVLKALDSSDLAEVKKNFEGGGNFFREWMNRLEQAVNGIKEVVMRAKTEPVAV